MLPRSQEPGPVLGGSVGGGHVPSPLLGGLQSLLQDGSGEDRLVCAPPDSWSCNLPRPPGPRTPLFSSVDRHWVCLWAEWGPRRDGGGREDSGDFPHPLKVVIQAFRL